MSRNLDIKYVYPETLTIGASITATIQPMPGQLGIVLKYGSGGTLFIQGESTALGSSFATDTKYRLGGTEIYSADLSGILRLYVDGATTTCYIARSFSQGSSLQIGS